MEIGGSGIDRPTFSGLASGIDTALLIEGLIAIERRPLDLVKARRDDLAEQQSLYRDFNSKLLALRDAARSLDNRLSTLNSASVDEEFLAFKATSTDQDVVTATATGAANPGDYEVRVTQLATAGRDITRAFASDTDPVASSGETLTLDFSDPSETDFTVTVGAGGASLRDLRDAINLHADNDGRIEAEILFDGSQYRLILSGTETGTENAFAVNGTGATLGDPAFVDAALHQDAGDATLQVLGVAVTSASNTVEDALPGVTFQLRGTNAGVAPGDPDYSETVSIEIDEEGIETELQSFVDAYNEVADFVSEQFEFDQNTNRAGPLGNDSLLRSLQSQLQGVLGGIYLTSANPLEPYSTLSSIGVEFGGDGRLSIDSGRLSDALGSNPQAVRRLLGGDPGGDDPATPAVEGDGAATALARFLEPIVRFGDGTLALRDDSLERQLGGLDESIERFEIRLRSREETLLLRFSALEASISALQAQSFFFNQVR